MVGLSVVLEAHNLKKNAATSTPKKTVLPLFISKTTMLKPPTTAASSGRSFLEACFLCRERLLQGRDIYMYKGDKAFCSEECRLKQMLMDEEDNINSDSPLNNDYNNHNACMKM